MIGKYTNGYTGGYVPAPWERFFASTRPYQDSPPLTFYENMGMGSEGPEYSNDPTRYLDTCLLRDVAVREIGRWGADRPLFMVVSFHGPHFPAFSDPADADALGGTVTAKPLAALGPRECAKLPKGALANPPSAPAVYVTGRVPPFLGRAGLDHVNIDQPGRSGFLGSPIRFKQATPIARSEHAAIYAFCLEPQPPAFRGYRLGEFLLFLSLPRPSGFLSRNQGT